MSNSNPHASHPAARIVIAYVLVGVAWALGSNDLLFWFEDAESLLPVTVLKSLGFVFTTAAVLFLFLRRHFAALEVARAALAASEERFELAMRGANDGLWDWCPQTNAVYYSPRWMSMLGYGEDELPHHRDTWLSLLHPDDAEPAKAQIRHLVEGQGDQIEYEFRLRHKDGHYVDILSRGQVVRNDQGTTLRIVGTHVDVSERKRATRSVEESERRLRRIFNTAMDGVVLVDGEGHITEVNDAYCSLCGYSRDELLGMGIRDMEARETAAETAARLQQLRAHDSYRFETQHRRKDGRIIDVEVSASFLGPPIGQFVAFCHDITDRKRAEQALCESEARFATVFQRSPVGIGIRDLTTGTIIDVNAAFLHMFDLERENVIGSTPDRLNFWANPADRSAMLEIVRERGYVEDFESRFRVGPDELGFMSFTGSIIELAGKPCLLGTFADITKRKRAEQALRESEERYRAIVEDQTDLISRFRPDGSFTFVNEVFSRFFGRSQEEMLVDGWVPLVVLEDLAHVRESLKSLSPSNPVVVVENRVFSGDGQVHWMQCVNRGLFDGDGEILEVQSVGRDITVRKAYEREIERLLEAAQAASKAKDLFIASLSHELRTPLTTILAAASSLQNDATLPAHVREMMARISRNAQREARLIDDLLDVTRLARGKIELQLRPVDLAEVLREIARDRDADFHARGQHLRIELPDEMCIIQADVDRLHQIFGNLLENAARFSSEGSQTVVHAEVTPTAAVVEVRDEGIGIDASAISRLFNAFEQGEKAPTGSRGGLGLGLSISRSIVELHGGTISAQSDGPGRGATFRVELPREQEMDQEVIAFRHESADWLQAAQPENAAPEHSLRALLVDDDEDIGWMFQSLLARAGHDVRLARSVTEGKNAALNEGPFDVFVIDLGLPDGTGHDLLRDLRDHGLNTASIALSGYGSPADFEQSRAAGFDTHLVKPVKFADLVDVMHQVSRAHSDRSRTLAES